MMWADTFGTEKRIMV